MSDQMLKAALAYAERGWPIFPARADKTPMIEGGVLNATTDRDQITRWWSAWPRANIALDVGGASLLVLDLDPGSDQQALLRTYGLPTTGLSARTPRGGTHLFYALQAGEIVSPSASKVAPHVDVRSFHSYVLLAPSRTDAGSYEWLGDGKPAFRTDELVRVANSHREKSADRDKWTIEPDLPENVEAAVAWLKKDAKIAVENVNGDNMAYATAAHLKSFGISQALAFDLMWEHWNPRCDPPWSAEDVEHLERKVENGYNYNTSPPGNITPAFKVAQTSALFRPVAGSVGSGLEYQAGRFRVVDRVGMDDIRPPEWLIPDLLPEDAFMILFGGWGSFKTFIALDMALTVATGFPTEAFWPPIAAAGPVLFAAGEGRAGITQRVRAWEKIHWGGEHAADFLLADPVPLVTEAWEPFVEAALAHRPEGYALVVLDTIGKAMQGSNENAQEHASKFTALTEFLRRTLQCSVLALHHTGHDNQDRAKGSTEFGNAADTIVRVERDQQTTFADLIMVKQKDAPLWDKPRRLKLTALDDTLVVVPPAPQELASGKSSQTASAAEQLFVLKSLDQALVAILKSNPERKWRMTELAEAMAHSDGIGISAKTIANTYLPVLREDKATAAHRCFDPLLPRSGGQFKWRLPN